MFQCENFKKCGLEPGNSHRLDLTFDEDLIEEVAQAQAQAHVQTHAQAEAQSQAKTQAHVQAKSLESRSCPKRMTGKTSKTFGPQDPMGCAKGTAHRPQEDK